MWTRIPTEHGLAVEKYMNDYSSIKIKKNGLKRKIGYEDINSLYFDQKIWLQSQIELSELPVVVVTHHSPLFEQKPKALDYAYHSDLTNLMNDKVKLWCHGHTHQYREVKEGDTIILCNPVGYPHEQTNYFNGKYIELLSS